MTQKLPFAQQNTKIGIFGLGVTGLATYKALRNDGLLLAWDDSLYNREAFKAIYPDAIVSDLSNSDWHRLDKIIMSPGIPLSHDIIKLAKSYNIPIVSDIDLLFEKCKFAQFIGITGTNGKSTTTALIYHILKTANLDFSMGGNIGTAALDLPLNQAGYVLELSSFQLDLIKIFSPNIAILLNITPDHLDRHSTMELYIKVKEKILTNLSLERAAIIGIDNEITKNIFQNFISQQTTKNVIPISGVKVQPGGVAVIKNKIYDNTNEALTYELPNNKALQGVHNKENIAASYAACRQLKVDIIKILEGIASFKCLPHRAQYLGTFENISFYNDSKATNAEAASKSLSFLNNIYWLAGGIGKEGGIETLSGFFNKIKKAYLYGRDKEVFASTLKGKGDYEIFEDLPSAFEQAFKDAKADDSLMKNILLAPAAASYDQFKNFEHRGEEFIQLYNKTILIND